MRCTFQTRQSARKTECVQEVSSLMLVPNTRTKYQDSSYLPAKEPVKKSHMNDSLKNFRLNSPTRDLFVYDEVDPYNERDTNYIETYDAAPHEALASNYGTNESFVS